MVESEEAKQVKRLAFFTVSLAAVTTLAGIIYGPILFNYIQYIQSSLKEELMQCMEHTHGLWEGYERVRIFLGPFNLV